MPPKGPRKAKEADNNSQLSSQAKSSSTSHFFTIPNPSKDSEISCLRSGSTEGEPSLIFTHGAGGGLSAPAVVNFTTGFSSISPVVSFKGSMNLSSRVKLFDTVCRHEQFETVLGGRSMGARAAAMAAVDVTQSVILVSYPLVSPIGEVRDQILLELPQKPDVLFISGENDNMCDFERLNEVRRQMMPRSWLVVVKGADHGMNVKPKKGTKAVGVETGKLAAEWVSKGFEERDEEKTECEIWWDEEEGVAKRSEWVQLLGGLDDKKVTDKTEQSKPSRKAKSERTPEQEEVEEEDEEVLGNSGAEDKKENVQGKSRGSRPSKKAKEGKAKSNVEPVIEEKPATRPSKRRKKAA